MTYCFSYFTYSSHPQHKIAWKRTKDLRFTLWTSKNSVRSLLSSLICHAFIRIASKHMISVNTAYSIVILSVDSLSQYLHIDVIRIILHLVITLVTLYCVDGGGGVLGFFCLFILECSQNALLTLGYNVERLWIVLILVHNNVLKDKSLEKDSNTALWNTEVCGFSHLL